MDDLTEQGKVLLAEKYAELVKIIQSFESLEKSKEWATLKELVFSKSLASIEKQLLNESSAPDISLHKLYKLQGELSWARKFNDINRFTDTLKKQLADIKTKLT
jgi:hypothetical protein